MSERAPYSRVYWSIIDDPKFADVYDDNNALATWLRLLMTADMAWPASAQIPVSCRRPHLDLLVRVGLVDLHAGSRYRIHGLDAERGERRAAATRLRTGRDPVGTQLGTSRDPDAAGLPGRRRDELSRDETSLDARADLEAFLAVRFRAPTPNQRTFLDAYCRTFDVTGPDRAARLIFANPDDPIGALKRDLEAWRAERKAAAIAEEPPKPKPRKSSGLTGVNAELAALYSAKYAEEGKA